MRYYLDALSGPVGPLVILTRKVLHGKDPGARSKIHDFVINLISRRFSKNSVPHKQVFRLVQPHPRGFIAQAALAGDPIAQPYLDADAVRILDGKPAFHKERFLALMAKEIAEVATE